MGRFSYIYLPSFKAYANISEHHGIFLSFLIATQSLEGLPNKKYTIAFLAGSREQGAGSREQGENKNILGLYLDNLFSGSPNFIDS
ncbi:MULTISPECIES: hypothetical protein [unclassified Tolypothrix]|uniref:hypothetical protein n=1 Tax=unclassified Tolypothrix TaxID=2649714 RepID=UPI0005EAAA23|nr:MULTISPECIES: hypothetical protein [unclassified Tolypothrix]BAY90580.1 hypothetical protein NIES3275_25970 [Microchaete diplosiphon NIES-3275]EKF01275.1 hypothetical protein FDUTEX481_08156 [Tolypothrix sp. PCC 7601]MBE9087425.1 hypothetical protein [Tolypothrix sp. LEGE 11397]UYD24734.1 hypothetical protein HGR01_25395 [Tolypothrix sp. PCC 7712]UYD33036.1 hypothetical protein HG267_29260 [Tolypothrix sp. PCC 7601]